MWPPSQTNGTILSLAKQQVFTASNAMLALTCFQQRADINNEQREIVFFFSYYENVIASSLFDDLKKIKKNIIFKDIIFS